MKVVLTDHTPDPVMAIERAAANCYDSKPSKSGRIMMACYGSGHHTPLEFATFTFHVEGVSRALLAQITRYRHMVFNVRSQRYCVEDDFKYIIPPKIAASTIACKAFSDCMDRYLYDYKQQLALQSNPEDARFVLPNACATAFDVSMNLRELIHFCGERRCARAQWEIRKLADMMAEEVIQVMPQAAQMLAPKCEQHAPYCFCTESKGCGKHPCLNEVYDA